MKGLCFFLLLMTVLGNTTAGGCVTSEGAENDCSCTFENMCCWRNNNRNSFNWTKDTFKPNVLSTSPAVLHMDQAFARLESSEICASVNVHYFLDFRYRITYNGQNAICQLSANKMVEEEFTPLWMANTSSANSSAMTPVSAITLANLTENFKVCFEARKLQGTDWCRIDIDEIVLHHVNVSLSSTPSIASTTTLSTTTTTTTATTTATTLPTSSSPPRPLSSVITQPPLSSTEQHSTSSTMPSSPSGQTGDKDGEPAGAIIGIVIALIILVLVCVVVIILIRRRVEGQKGLASLTCKKFRKLHKKSKEGVPSVTISASTGGDDIIPVGNDVNTSCVSRGTVTNGRPQHGTSPYEIEDIQESSNYYSVPVNKYGAPAVRPTYKTKTQSSDYELAAIVESGGDYSTVDDADLEGRRAKARPDEYAKVKKPKGGNYNKLSFQNPGFDGKAEDTYNHIQDEEPVYKVPRSDGNEYSLATNPGASSVGRSAGGSSEPHYVIVDGKGKDDAARGGDDEYNHLNLRKEPSANVPDSTDRGAGAGVYNHLDDQNHGPPGVQTEDTYNRVNYDGHTQDQNRKQNAGNYSHIGGF